MMSGERANRAKASEGCKVASLVVQRAKRGGNATREKAQQRDQSDSGKRAKADKQLLKVELRKEVETKLSKKQKR